VDLYSRAQLQPAALGKGKVATRADLARDGLSRSATLWQADHGRIVRAFRDAYVLGVAAPDIADKARAALAVSGSHCLVGFHTAAALLGFGVVTDDAVHLVVPPGKPFPTHHGIRVHQSVVPVRAPTVWKGIPCTPPARTAIDLARTLDRPYALAILDAALSSGTCTYDDLVMEVAHHGGLRGVKRARSLVGLADGRSQCVQETHLRLILHDAGLCEFEPQVPVHDDYGTVRCYLDLADQSHRVAVEYDGASHLDRSRLRQDRERHNWLDGRGWRMRYFTDRDLYRYPDRIVRIVRSAQHGR
jgi:very-short-patch-repair endonuclease